MHESDHMQPLFIVPSYFQTVPIYFRTAHRQTRHRHFKLASVAGGGDSADPGPGKADSIVAHLPFYFQQLIELPEHDDRAGVSILEFPRTRIFRNFFFCELEISSAGRREWLNSTSVNPIPTSVLASFVPTCAEPCAQDDWSS
jgi:hypothetical protein